MATVVTVDAKDREGNPRKLHIKHQMGDMQVQFSITREEQTPFEGDKTIWVNIHDLIPMTGAVKEHLTAIYAGE